MALQRESGRFPGAYKAAQISKKGGDFELVDVRWKDPEAGQVVVKVLACGICLRCVTSVLFCCRAQLAVDELSIVPASPAIPLSKISICTPASPAFPATRSWVKSWPSEPEKIIGRLGNASVRDGTAATARSASRA